MNFTETLRKKFNNHPYSKELRLEDPKFIKINGSCKIIHLNVDIKSFILILTQTKDQLNSFCEDLNDNGIHIYSKGYTVSNPSIKPIGFMNKLKFLFSSNTQFSNNNSEGPIIVLGIEKLPYTKIIGSCRFESKAIKQDDLRIDLFGSGSIDLEGKVVNLVSHLDGSGMIDARDLFCSDFKAVLDGSGCIYAQANYSSDIELNGSGYIEIKGKPSFKFIKKTGSGRISIN